VVVLLCVIGYVIGSAYYGANHFYITYKEQMWKNAPEHQVIEEVKYLLRKHGDASDLETMESIINESKRLTKYNENYRNDCYNQGLNHRVKLLEAV
jgi:2C-methyl-D-erythritol 2,4-cyclodiphosphate synthase